MNIEDKTKLKQIQNHNRIDIYTSEDIFILTFGYKTAKPLQVDFLKPIPLVELIDKNNLMVTTIDLDNFDFIVTEKSLKLKIKTFDEIIDF